MMRGPRCEELSRSGEIRSMTEGALLAGISVILALAGFYLPIVGPVVILLWPVPIVVIHLRHGIRTSILTVATAGLVLMAFVGPLGGLAVVLSSGIVGIALGAGFRRKWMPTATFGLGVAAVLVSTCISLAIASLVMHVNVIEDYIGLLEKSMRTSFSIYEQIGLGGAAFQEASDAWEQALSRIRFLMPTAVVGAAFLHSYVNFEFSRVTLSKLGYEAKTLPPFGTWRMPVWAVIGFFAGSILAHAGPGYPGWVRPLGTNLLYAFSMAFMVQGAAVVYHFLSRYRVTKWLRVIIVAYLCMIPFLGQLIVWAGVLDSGFNFRKLSSMRREQSGGGHSRH